MLFFFGRNKKKDKDNEFISIEKRFEQVFWQQIPPLDNVRVYIEPEEAIRLGLDRDAMWIRINTAVNRENKSVFECIDVGNMSLVFRPVKQLEQFINNADILLRKLV